MPLLRLLGGWLMLRGVDPGQPGFWVVIGGIIPILALLPLILLVAMSYELITRLDRRRRLGPSASWLLAGALSGVALGSLLVIAGTM